MKSRIQFLGIALLLNLAFLVLGLFDIFDGWPLYQIPLLQVLWLLGLARTLGFPVEGRANEFAALPNAFGWFFVVAGTLITLSIYVWLSRIVVRFSDTGKNARSE